MGVLIALGYLMHRARQLAATVAAIGVIVLVLNIPFNAIGPSLLDLLKPIGYMLVVSPILVIVSGFVFNAGGMLVLALHSYRLPSVIANAVCITLRIAALYGLWVVLLHSSAIVTDYRPYYGNVSVADGQHINFAYFMICAPFVVQFGGEMIEEVVWMVLGPFVGHPIYRLILQDELSGTL